MAKNVPKNLTWQKISDIALFALFALWNSKVQKVQKVQGKKISLTP